MGKRQNVELDANCHAILDGVVEWTGQPKKRVAMQLVKWFGTLDEDTQGAIVGALPSSRTADFARMLLEKMAGVSHVPGEAPGSLTDDSYPPLRDDGGSQKGTHQSA